MATLTVRGTRLLKIDDTLTLKIPVCNVDAEKSGKFISNINIANGFSFLTSIPAYYSNTQTLHTYGAINKSFSAGNYGFIFSTQNNKQYNFQSSSEAGYNKAIFYVSENGSYGNCFFVAIPIFVITPTNKVYFTYTDVSFVYVGSNANPQNSDLVIQQTPTTGVMGEGIITVLREGFTNTRLECRFSEAESHALYDATSDIPTDPYSNAGDSTTGGGDGTFDGSSDPVPVPSLPSVGATDTGFITLFVPTRAQLKQVAEYMWGGLFDVSTWKRLFEDPMDCILGLSVVPVTIPATTSGNITVGNIELSGISLPVADQQYIEVDCGTIDFSNRYFGSYLDFEPYTKMSLFVPYSGVHSVSADDIIGKVVGLKYHIDILTGSLVAFLTCGDSVLYEFNGACASNIPVNSMNYASTIENAIRIAVNIGTTVATAGASAPVQGISQAQQTARNIGTGISLAGSTTEGALSLKPNIDRAGSLGGTTGLMGHQIPYFIITRPRLCKPKNQDFFQGYPSFIQTSVGDLIGKGFTSFTNIIIAESFMTDAENEELESILQGGVYL